MAIGYLLSNGYVFVVNNCFYLAVHYTDVYRKNEI